MKTVFLTGAGCTRNYRQASHGIQDLQPPLNSDFFAMARKVVLSRNLGSSKELQRLLRTICNLYRLRFDSQLNFLESDSLRNLEAVMTNLAYQETLFGARASQFLVSSRDTLRELIALTIQVSLQGPPCRLHKKLASLVKPQDLVLTTNYDHILDEALAALNRMDDLSYALPFHRVHDGRKWKRTREIQGSYEFLKLHGSTNWARCIECSTLLKTSKSFAFRPLVSLACPRCQSAGGIVRLIIPPLQSKEYNEDPYRFLWLHAARRIEEMERIVVLGYGFSTADIALEALLHRIKTKHPIIEIMNNTKDRDSIKEPLRRIFPNVEPKWTLTLSDFLAGYRS